MKNISDSDLQNRYDDLESIDLKEVSEQKQILIQNIKEFIMEILMKNHRESREKK